MQVFLFTAISVIAGCSCGRLHEEHHSATDVRRPAALNHKHLVQHRAAGSPAFDIRQTSDHGRFPSHLRLVLDNRGKQFGYSHLLSNPHRRLRPHEKKELNGETMGTTGGHSIFKRRRSHRHKRGTKEHHKRAFNIKKGLKTSAVALTPPQTHSNTWASSLTLWEPMPKPLALTATHFPFDVTHYAEFHTRRVDDPWGGTPMTPPYVENEGKGFFPNPFYPVTDETPGAYAVAVVSVLLVAVGVTGNVAVMCVVCHNYYMRSISNALLANLAVWDLVLLVFCLPLVVFHELTDTWLLGQVTCKVIPYIEVASLGVVTFTLCALCIDRFRAATNVQMYYQMMESCTSTAAKLAVIWIGALLLALPELLIRQLVSENGDAAVEDGASERCLIRVSTSLPDTLYVLGLAYEGARLWWCFGCYFCLPTLFTISSSVATARRIRRAARGCARGNKKQIQLESQMNCTVVALAIVYGACVVPENVCSMVSVYMAAGVAQSTMSLLHLLSQLLLFLRAAATPVLLLCLCRPFGRTFLECCCCADACGVVARSPATGSADNEHECSTELDLSPFSTIRREMSNCTDTASHC